VPVVLPLGMVFAGVAVSWFAGRRRLRTVVVVLAVLLVARSIRPAMLLLADPPQQGVRAAVSSVAGLLPESSVTVLGPGAPSHLGLALRYQFDRLSLVVSGPREQGALEEAVRSFVRDGRPVRVVVPSAVVHPDRIRREEFGTFALRPVQAVHLEFRAFDASADRLPEAMVSVRRTVEVYEVVAPFPRGQALPLVIDLGELDFGWVGSGFHGPELIDGAGVRWTNGEARLVLPSIALPDGAALAVTSRMSGSRPDGLRPTVVLDLGGEAVASFRAGTTMAEHRVELSASATARLAAGGVLTVRTESFIPADFGSGDGRRLGVLLDWVRVDVIDARGRER
jgi:hypothetical protein